MDGASKFVRGDAVAGILILFINILGGFAIGTLQHDLDASQAAQNCVLILVTVWLQDSLDATLYRDSYYRHPHFGRAGYEC